jgi:3',5'-nucleoside bisphosphate phosphatase
VRIDLHLHSTASDGSLSPSAVVWAALSGGLHVIALTDHDTTNGIAEAQAAGRGGVHVISAIEMSTMHRNAELHMLGYFVDHRSPLMLDYSAMAARRREERMHGMIERLGSLGIHVAYTDVLQGIDADTRSLGRPHLARALVERGHVTTLGEAFDRYLGDEGPAYLPVQLLSSEDAIALIHEAGGLAVWAHPRIEEVEQDIDALHALGLDGIECHRPRSLPIDSLKLEHTARERGMLVTGGSDWHGTWHGRLGEFSVSREEVGEFLERGGI